MDKFPAPEVGHAGPTYVLEAGLIKCIFLDPQAAAEGNPAWLIYLPGEYKVHRAREWNTLHAGGLQTRGRGSRKTPLLPGGPAFWVETVAAIEATT